MTNEAVYEESKFWQGRFDIARDNLKEMEIRRDKAPYDMMYRRDIGPVAQIDSVIVELNALYPIRNGSSEIDVLWATDDRKCWEKRMTLSEVEARIWSQQQSAGGFALKVCTN